MKFATITICFLCAMALEAAQVTLPGNPYTPIVARNVFNLNPPQPVITAPSEPPPKITANGIMSIFGSKQALFKVTIPAQRGQPPKETSYILSEGQRQDDIEVMRIDESAGVVTFNNHGTIQDISLTTAPALTMNMPSVPTMVKVPAPPMFTPMNPGNNVNAGNFGNRFGRNLGNHPGQNSSSGFNGNYAGYSGQNTSAQPQMTPEEQEVIIAAQHAHALQTGDPTAAIYPPTSLDSQAGIPTPPAP